MANQLISVREYKEFIKEGQGIILFKSNWCRTSIMMAIVFDKLAKKYGSIAKFGKIDIDAINEVVQHARVSAIPEFIFYKDGKLEGRQHCTQTENLETFFKEYIIEKEEDEY